MEKQAKATAKAIVQQIRATDDLADATDNLRKKQAETYEEFVKQQEDEKKLLKEREKWQEQYDQDQVDQARRTVRQKNAILYDSKDFMQYSNTVRSLQEKNAKQSIANFEKQYDEYLKLTKAHAKEIGDIQEKQNATNLKFMKKYYQGRIDIVEKNFVKETETIQKGLEDIRDYVEGDFYDTFEDSIKDVVEQFTGLEDQTESTMEKLRDNFSKTFGDDEDGLVGQITSAINQLSSIDLLNGFNLNSLVNEISGSDSDWGKFRNEAQNQYGITPEQLEAWVSDSLGYVNEDLNGKFDFGEVQGLLEQMLSSGITQQDQRDTYTKPLLSAIGALDVDMSTVQKFLQFDMDRGMGAELLTDTAADLNMAIQSQQYQGLNSNKAFEELSDMLGGVVQLGSRNGVNISNESLMSLNTALSAGIASMSGVTMGGESEEAFKNIMNAIMGNNVLHPEEASLALDAMKINAEAIRSMMVSGSAEDQRDAVAQVINAMVNAARSGVFNPNSTGYFALSEAGLIPESMSSEALTELSNALANKSTEDALKTNFDNYFRLAEVGDQSTLDTYTQSIMKVPAIESTLNKLTNSFQSSSMGQAIREWFSDLGGTLSGALEPMFLIKNLLMGSNDGIFSWLFGKSGGGTAGGGGAGGGILGGIGKFLFGKKSTIPTGTPLTSAEDIAELASSGKSPLAQLWQSTGGTSLGAEELAAASGSKGLFGKIASGASKLMGGAGGKVLGAIGKVAPWLAVAEGGIDAFMGFGKAKEWTGQDTVEGGISSSIGAFLGGTGNGVKEGGFLENAGEIGGGALKGAGIGAAIGSIVPGVGTAIGAGVGAAIGGVGSAIGGDTLAQWFSPVINGISDGAKGLWNGIVDFGTGTWDWVKQTGKDIWGGIESAGNATWQWMQDTGAAIADTPLVRGLTNAGKAIGDEVSSFWNDVVVPNAEYFGDQLEGAKKAVADFASDVWNKGVDFWNNTIAPGLQDLGNGIASVASDIWNNGIVPAFNWLSDWIMNCPIVKAFQDFSGWITSQIPNYYQQEGFNELTDQGKKEAAGAVRYDEPVSKTLSGSEYKNQLIKQNKQNYQQGATGLISGVFSGDLSTESLMKDQLRGGNKNSTYVRGYANGLSEVPYDEYPAVLHKGEAVLTANQAEQVRADGGIDIQESLTKAFQTSQNDALRNFVYENNTGTQNGMSLYDAVFKIYNTLQTYANKSLSSQQVISNKISSLATNKTYGGTTVATVSKITSPQTTPTTIQHDPDTRLNKSETTPKDETGKTTTTTTTTTTTPKVPSSTDLHDPEKRANSYAVGTPYVPNDQLALIHQGEMVVPKEFNPYANASSVMPYNVDNGDVVQIIQWLGSTLTRKLDEVEGVIQSSTPRTVPGQRGTTMSDIAFSL